MIAEGVPRALLLIAEAAVFIGRTEFLALFGVLMILPDTGQHVLYLRETGPTTTSWLVNGNRFS